MRNTNTLISPRFHLGLVALTLVLGMDISFCAPGGSESFTSADTPLPELVAQSAVIAYANADTNKVPNIRLGEPHLRSF